jgi:CelD/BcsL family acetyltransferase involved in cellulose biosynthesis
VRTRVISDAAELAAISDGWDALAVAAGRPMAGPAWGVAWLRHGGGDGDVRVAVAERDGRVVGVAPYVAATRRSGVRELRPVGHGAHRIGPVAAPEELPAVGRELARALAAAEPGADVVAFEAVDADSPWPDLFADGWASRRPVVHWDGATTLSAPAITLSPDGFDAWLAGKSPNFRQQVRRLRRRIASAGGSFRVSATEAELERDLAAFEELHHGRWAGRGGTALMLRSYRELLLDCGRALLPAERFRLWVLTLDGRVVSAQIFLAAGDQVAYFNGGFDERVGDLKPGLMTIVAAVEDAFRRGERRMDLGGGALPYKLRLADDDAPLVWKTLFPRGRRYVRTRAVVLPGQVVRRGRVELRRRTDPELRRRARQTLRRALRRSAVS